MIIHPHKALFIHIPKTGGTSVGNIMRKHLSSDFSKEEMAKLRSSWPNAHSKHDTSLAYSKTNPLLFKEYFKFTFVRNPWDLTFSLYNYLWRGNAAWPKKWREKDWSKRRDLELDLRIACVKKEHLKWSFKEWVKSELFLLSSPAARWCKNCNQNQLDWISDKDGRINIDFVGRFENFEKDFIYVCNKMKAPELNLPHHNPGPKRKHYSEYYDDETKDIVAKKYSRDIESFNYKFENNT